MNIVNDEIPVFFISMERSSDRRIAALDAGLRNDWIENYFPAVDMSSSVNLEKYNYFLISDFNEFANTYGRKIKAGELGCSLSHLSVFRRMVQEDIAMSVVFEDDILPVLDYEKKLRKCWSDLLIMKPMSNSFVCHLGVTASWYKKLIARPILFFYRFKFFSSDVMILKGMQQIWLTHAYIISNAAAKKILASEADCPILADDWLLRMKRGDIENFYITKESLFFQNIIFESTVQDGNNKIDVSLERPLKFNIWFNNMYFSVKKFFIQFVPLFKCISND